MNRNLYPILNREWTVKGNGGKYLLYNYKRGISEDRYDLSQTAYSILKLADGNHSIRDISRATGEDPLPYFQYLNGVENGIVEFSEIKLPAFRSFLPEYGGHNFLGRVLWHITGRCNAVCKHCYIGNQKWDELTLEEASSFIEQLARLNVYAVSITGGEPFVHPHLLEILRGLDSNEIKVEGIFTNGTLLSESKIEAIESIQEIPFFISINGPQPDLHDQFMGFTGGYERVIDNFRMASRMGVTLFANTSLSVLVGDAHRVREFYELVKTLGIKRWRVSTPFLEGNWLDNYEQLGLSLDDEIRILKDILALWLADGRPLELELGHVFRYIDGQSIVVNYTTSDYVCDYFRERIVIMPNGNVSACPLLINPPYTVGNIRTQSLEMIWESPQMRYYKDLKVEDVLKDECRACPMLSKCGVGCRANAVLMGKHYEDIDPTMCQIYRGGYYAKVAEALTQAGLI